MRRRGALAIAAAAGAAAVAAVALADGPGDDGRRTTGASERMARSAPAMINAPRWPRGPAQALVTTGGLTASATVETHCLKGPSGPYCADSVGLADDSPILPADRGSAVGIHLGTGARSLTAWVARVQNGIGGERISPPVAARDRDRAGRLWRFDMPGEPVPEGAALRFKVRYRDYRGEPVLFLQRMRTPDGAG